MGETVVCERDLILAKSMFSNLKDARTLRQRQRVGCEVKTCEPFGSDSGLGAKVLHASGLHRYTQGSTTMCCRLGGRGALAKMSTSALVPPEISTTSASQIFQLSVPLCSL